MGKYMISLIFLPKSTPFSEFSFKPLCQVQWGLEKKWVLVIALLWI
jgi:hypothetical protein